MKINSVVKSFVAISGGIISAIGARAISREIDEVHSCVLYKNKVQTENKLYDEICKKILIEGIIPSCIASLVTVKIGKIMFNK